MNKPKWLREDEQRAWLNLALMMSGIDGALDHQLQRDSGISHRTYLFLAALSNAPDGTMRMTDLAQATHGSPSRVSHAVARLEMDGWVERSRPDDDKRLVYATLTEAGRALLRTAAPGHVAEVRKVLIDRLSAEQLQQLTEIAGASLNALAELGFAPPGWPDLPGPRRAG